MVVRGFVQIAQLSVLTHYLPPADYGLMAAVLVVIGLGGLFADMGLGAAFVQKPVVTDSERSSLYWANLATGFGVWFALASLSPVLAAYFGDETLAEVVPLASLTIPISAAGQQLRLAAEKALQFGRVVAIEVAGGLAAFAISVTLAVAGHGVYALVFGSLAGSALVFVMNWLVLSNGWRPQFAFRPGEVKPYLGFGLAVVASNVVNYFNSSVDLVLGGRLFTSSQLGLYSVPRSILLQVQTAINPVMTRVMFPLVAGVQKDSGEVRSIYLGALRFLSSVNAPIYLFAALYSGDLVDAFLGHEWGGSSQILSILALWAFFRSMGNPVGALLNGVGRADLSLKWNVGLLCVVPASILVGSRFGVAGVAYALLAVQVLALLPHWYFLVRVASGATFYEYICSFASPFALAALSLLPGFALTLTLESGLVRLLVGALSAGVLYLVASAKFNRVWLADALSLLGISQRA